MQTQTFPIQHLHESCISLHLWFYPNVLFYECTGCKDAHSSLQKCVLPTPCRLYRSNEERKLSIRMQQGCQIKDMKKWRGVRALSTISSSSSFANNGAAPKALTSIWSAEKTSLFPQSLGILSLNFTTLFLFLPSAAFDVSTSSHLVCFSLHPCLLQLSFSLLCTLSLCTFILLPSALLSSPS